jgi:hypothetical protein
MLGRLFGSPALTRVFTRNLKLPAGAFERLDTSQDAAEVARAAEAVLAYVTEHNPQFFNYRFGYGDGATMMAGLARLRDVAREAGGQIVLRVEKL